jgi:hypothetical protein
MKYAVEIGQGDMMYIPSFKEIRSGIQNSYTDTHTERQLGDVISPLLFFSQ